MPKEPYYEEDPESTEAPLRPDSDLHSSDWAKKTWDLPPYKSDAFFEQVHDLDSFRKTPTYKHAVEQGLIHDDEWVAHHVTPRG